MGDEYVKLIRPNRSLNMVLRTQKVIVVVLLPPAPNSEGVNHHLQFAIPAHQHSLSHTLCYYSNTEAKYAIKLGKKLSRRWSTLQLLATSWNQNAENSMTVEMSMATRDAMNHFSSRGGGRMLFGVPVFLTSLVC